MRIPRRALIVLALIGCAASLRAVAPAAESAPATESAPASADLAAARALFERNLDAIRHRDREAYLACYLESETLALNGVGGLNLGYEALAKNAGSGWPDVFDGQDLQLVPLAPGIVYASYRYRVRYGEVEQTGRSERVFRSTPEGWRIAVSTAFSDSPGTSAPPRALVGGTLIDGTGEPATPDSVVVLRDGKIQCAGSRAACPVPADAGVVDVKGTWITPGLIDAHVHFSQTGWVDGRPDALDLRVRHPYEQVEADLRAHPERFWRADLCSGVTAVLDAGGYPWSLGLEERAENDTRAP
ncbi:MAG: hypothetical protein ABI609_07185, partial [Acidobacteriota bacterium]